MIPKLNQKITNSATAFAKHANDKTNNSVPANAEESADESNGFAVGDVLGVEVGNKFIIGDVVGVEVGDVLVLGDVLGTDVGTPRGNVLGKELIDSRTTGEGDDVDILSTCSVIQS